MGEIERLHHLFLASNGVCTDTRVILSGGLFFAFSVFVMGPERALEMLARVPGHPEAVIIDRDLRIWTTPGTQDRLVMRATLEDGRLPGPTAFGAR